MRKFNFVSMKWNGYKVYAFTDKGEEMERNEFVIGSETDKAFAELEELLKNEPAGLQVSLQ